MRWMVLAFVVGCGGGADCDWGRARVFDATRILTTNSACADLPISFVIRATAGAEPQTLVLIEEDKQPATARTAAPLIGCHAFGTFDTEDLWHRYSLELNGEGFAYLSRPNTCTAGYVIRLRH